MTRYKTSSGEYVDKKTIDKKIRQAKAKVIMNHMEEYGYHFCTKCFKPNGVPIDCSHIESVDSCQKNGYVEKSWDINNIQLICRDCHKEYDKLNLKFNANNIR